jgi:Nucleotidyl transferase AbiEii toxin, Type IV TA system
VAVDVIPYEVKLDRDFPWALREGSMHFEENSAVQNTLKRIAKRLDELKVPYAIAGGMALYYHGYRRFTEDVDIVVDRDGLNRIHAHLDGLGYLPPFHGSKNLRDTDTGVRIEFLITGDYPGDGKPKPVVFPNPESAATEVNGMKFLPLETLVDMKLASGMTNPRRGKDLIDVQELIDQLKLDESFADKLNPYVRPKFLEILTMLRDNPVTPE